MRLLRTKLSRWKVGDLFFLLYCLFFMASIDFIVAAKKPSVDLSCPTPCVCTMPSGVVNCSDKNLKEIPKNTPKWVTILSLRNAKITFDGLSSFDFSSLTHLEELDLSENRIQNFTVDLTGTYSLRKIVLSHCSISSFPDVKVQNNITHLTLSHNSITEVGQILKNLPHLLVLDLSYNKIKQLRPGTFQHQSKLTHLYLEKNKVTALEWSSLSGLDSIDTIDLSRNKIRNIEKSSNPQPGSKQEVCFGNMKNLKHINLSQNQIGQIDGLTFSGMCKLETLRLDRNRITKLSDGAFYGPEKLKSLYLDHNHINAVTRGWLFELKSLETLSASYNNMSKIEPDGWDFCKELVHLNLSHNHLPSLSRFGFLQLSKLQTLHLDYNKVNVLEDEAFRGLSELKTLDISFNEISSSIEDINGAFLGLSSIEHLSLRRNKIRTLSSSVLEGLENVITLDLRENNVTSIQNHTFDEMHNLRKLQITSESFLCDCQLAWFPAWLSFVNKTEQDFSSVVRGNCFHPPKLKGRDILSIQPTEFVCGDHPIPVLLQEPRSLTALRGDNITLECSASATYTDTINETTPTPVPGEGASPDSVESRTTGNSPSRESFLSLQAEKNTKTEDTKNRMTINWKRGQKIIHHGEGIEIRNQTRREAGYIYLTSVLVLTGVTSADDGLYNCIIGNEYGYARSKPVHLKVNEFPKFTKVPMNVTVVKNGSAAILDCAATGEPSPQITWQKDGGKDFPAATTRRLLREQKIIRKVPQIIVESESPKKGGLSDLLIGGTSSQSSNGDDNLKDMFMVDTDAPLHIGVVLPEDAGEYECVVQSSVGRIVAKAMLIVETAPSFAKPMQKYSKAVVGGNAVIQCMADANPPPQISWDFNGDTLNHTSRHFMAADGQVLVIVDTRLTDVGDYTCTIWNRLGRLNGSTELQVYQRASEIGGESLFSMLFGGNTTTGIMVIVVFVCIVFTSLVWLIILCYARKNPDHAHSTNTDITDLPPTDLHSYTSTDESIRKCQSSQSIHSLEQEANAVLTSGRSGGRYEICHQVSASASDIRLMQISQQETPGFQKSFNSDLKHPLDSANRMYRCQSSSAIKKDQPILTRFRSTDNFRLEDRQPLHHRAPSFHKKFDIGRVQQPPEKPITSPSSYFAMKAAKEDTYIPVHILNREKLKENELNANVTLPESASSSAPDPRGSRNRAKKLKKIKVHNQRKLMQQGNEQSENSDSAVSCGNGSGVGGRGHRLNSPSQPMGQCNGTGCPNRTRIEPGLSQPHEPHGHVYTHRPVLHTVRQCDKNHNMAKSQGTDTMRNGNTDSWRSYHYKDRRKNEAEMQATSAKPNLTRSPLGGRSSRTDSDISSSSNSKVTERSPCKSKTRAVFSSNDTLASEESTLLSSESNSTKARSHSATPSSGHESERLLTSST